MKRLENKIDVLIDTDVDFDDYMAMLYLLKHPDVNVKGITVTGAGDVHLHYGGKNVSNLLTLLEDPEALKIPVALGAKSPMIYSNTYPGEMREAADNHYDSPFLGENPNTILDDAIEFLRDFIINTKTPIQVLSIGGGSNWGRLFDLAKTDIVLKDAIHANVERCVMMGGNILPQPGNIQDALSKPYCYTNKVAEWNIFVDPLGAEEMFAGGIPITLVALNATKDIEITEEFVEKIHKIDTEAAKFLYKVLESETIKPGIGQYLDFWDPLAACALVNPNLIATKDYKLRIELELDEENDTSGMLIIDEDKGHNISVALSAQSNETVQEFLSVIAL
jgi:pyrimidine-specific ribonucleoside hydrolase